MMIAADNTKQSMVTGDADQKVSIKYSWFLLLQKFHNSPVKYDVQGQVCC